VVLFEPALEGFSFPYVGIPEAFLLLARCGYSDRNYIAWLGIEMFKQKVRGSDTRGK
jgi:hypothetical protein